MGLNLYIIGLWILYLLGYIHCNSVNFKRNEVHRVAVSNQGVLDTAPNGCSCSGNKCDCCLFLSVPRIHLNETGCVVMAYLPEEIGVDMQLTLNGRVLIEEKVSLKNPPPLCVGIPHLHDYASLCVILYNVTYSGKVGGCVKIAAKLAGLTIEELKIGCFYYNDKVAHQSFAVKIFHHFYEILKSTAQGEISNKMNRGKIYFDNTNVPI